MVQITGCFPNQRVGIVLLHVFSGSAVNTSYALARNNLQKIQCIVNSQIFDILSVFKQYKNSELQSKDAMYMAYMKWRPHKNKPTLFTLTNFQNLAINIEI